MKSECIRVAGLEQMLKRSPEFDARARQINSRSHAPIAIRLKRARRQLRRKIRRVIQLRLRRHVKSAAQHRARPRTARPRRYREDQRVPLQISNPDRIQPLVEYSEWREVPPEGKRHVLVGDVIDLNVIGFFLEISFPTWSPRIRYQVRLKRAAPFDQPFLPDRD